MVLHEQVEKLCCFIINSAYFCIANLQCSITILIKMKKYFLLSLLSLLIYNNSKAQITYTSISFPQASDVLFISTAIDTLLTVTAPSSLATAWDFSHFVAINTTTDTIQPASNGADYALFPTTEVIQPLFGQLGIAYVDVTSTKVERLGGGLELLGLSFVAPYANTHITQVVPLTYGTTLNDTYSLNYGEHIDSIPFLRQIIDSLVNLPFGLKPDSIRFSIVGTETLNVDAWGTCRMSDTIYDVLRQKAINNYDLRIEARIVVPFLGAQWINVTTYLPLPFPTKATTVRYDFLAEGTKQPIVRLNLDSAETIITSIEFLDSFYYNPPTIDVRYLESELAVRIYPNPAQNYVQIEMAAADIPVNGYNLLVVDMVGRVILTENAINNENHQVNTSTIAAGNYVVVLRDKTGKILKRSLLEISSK